MKVKRYFVVHAPKSKVLHRYFGSKLVEGEKAACGIRLGWHWLWFSWPRRAKLLGMRRCQRCDNAKAPAQILVQRVQRSRA